MVSLKWFDLKLNWAFQTTSLSFFSSTFVNYPFMNYITRYPFSFLSANTWTYLQFIINSCKTIFFLHFLNSVYTYILSSGPWVKKNNCALSSHSSCPLVALCRVCNCPQSLQSGSGSLQVLQNTVASVCISSYLQESHKICSWRRLLCLQLDK